MSLWNTPLRRESRGKTPCSQPFVVDDYGDAVYFGRYTNQLCWPDESRYYGAIVPQVKACYVDLLAADAAHRASVALFNEYERNCNTCAKLVRVPHAKCRFGFLYGRCSGSKESHPYLSRMRDGVFMFHAEDHMNMSCWEKRK